MRWGSFDTILGVVAGKVANDESTVSFLPLSHVFQRMVDYCLYWLGFSIAYSTIDNAVVALGEVKPTIVVAVPRVYEKVYEKVLTASGLKRRIVLWARSIAASTPLAGVASRSFLDSRTKAPRR